MINIESLPVQQIKGGDETNRPLFKEVFCFSPANGKATGVQTETEWVRFRSVKSTLLTVTRKKKTATARRLGADGRAGVWRERKKRKIYIYIHTLP